MAFLPLYAAFLPLYTAFLLLVAGAPAPVDKGSVDGSAALFFRDAFQRVCPADDATHFDHLLPGTAEVEDGVVWTANGRSAGEADAIPLFVHVPKTGGTSLNAVLLEAVHAAGRRFCSIGVGDTRLSDGAADVALYAGCDVLSGELDGSIRFQVPSRPFTLLRDPVLRALSQYEHHNTHGRYEADSKTHAQRLTEFFSPSLCNQNTAHYCAKLSDPSKCGEHGWCGIFHNHQTTTLVGSRAYGEKLRATLRRDTAAVVCAAEAQLAGMAVVGR